MKLQTPHPSLRATLSPLGRGEEIVVSSLWLDSIRPQAERYSLLPLSAKRGEGRGEGRVLVFLDPRPKIRNPKS